MPTPLQKYKLDKQITARLKALNDKAKEEAKRLKEKSDNKTKTIKKITKSFDRKMQYHSTKIPSVSIRLKEYPKHSTIASRYIFK